MNTEIILKFARLIPLFLEIGREVAEMAERLRADGYEIPSAQDLKELNERLRNLPDAK